MDKFNLPITLQNEFSIEEIEQMKEQFNDFDENGNGSIEIEELFHVTKSMGFEINEDELVRLVYYLDDDKSGALEFQEFVKLISSLRRGQGGKLGLFIQHTKQAFRIREEFKNIINDPIPNINLFPVKGNMRKWTATINGPLETPYEGGCFNLEILFDLEYPYSAPDVVFTTKIFHINFVQMLNGTSTILCLLNQWNAEWTMRKLLSNIVLLMISPDIRLMKNVYRDDEFFQLSDEEMTRTTCRSFLNKTMEMYIHNRDEYENYARYFTNTFAIIS